MDMTSANTILIFTQLKQSVMAKKEELQRTSFSQIRRNKEQGGVEQVTPPVQRQSVVKPIAKQGRPTKKDPNLNYVRIGALVPESMRDRMHTALRTYLKGTHLSLDELITFAITSYLDSNESNTE
jgi:hypothetical protein